MGDLMYFQVFSFHMVVCLCTCTCLHMRFYIYVHTFFVLVFGNVFGHAYFQVCTCAWSVCDRSLLKDLHYPEGTAIQYPQGSANNPSKGEYLGVCIQPQPVENVYVFVSVYLYMHVYVHMCICVCVCFCVCTCLCICVNVYEHVLRPLRPFFCLSLKPGCKNVDSCQYHFLTHSPCPQTVPPSVSCYWS